MGDSVEFPEKDTRERRTVTDGFFEREIYLSGDETATFLHDLADAIGSDRHLTVSGEDWKIPFDYREPVEVEIEFSKQREGELEIEVEFTEANDGTGLDVS